MSRRQQWRLLLLVMSLGLAIILMIEARNPENWRWLEMMEAGAEGRRELADHKPSAARQPSNRADGAGPDSSQQPATSKPRAILATRPEDLEPIRDDTTFRNDKKDAWFQLLRILSTTDEASLQRASQGTITFAQLSHQSDEYRGQLLTIRGTIRRAEPLDAPANDCGITGYTRLWLQPEDNSDEPIVVYVLTLPAAFPEGKRIDEAVTTTGFYFKRWAYLAGEGIRVAPVVLAKTVHWHKRPPIAPRQPRGPVSLLAVVVSAAVIAVLVTGYIYSRTRRSSPPDTRRTMRLEVFPGEDAPPTQEKCEE